MGGFLTLVGTAGVERRNLERALEQFVTDRGGTMAPDSDGLVFPDGIVITPGTPGRFSIFLPGSLPAGDEMARDLSRLLKAPAISMHVHDGDFWMYSLFAAGKAVDSFNPIPDYWGDSLSDADLKKCAGNAQAVARHWPDLDPGSIKRYLVAWDVEAIDSEKAYPDDQYAYNDCQQLTDFMRRLGLAYPLDDDGGPIGDVYCVELP